MEAAFKVVADHVALFCELIAVVLLGVGAVQVVVMLLAGVRRLDRGLKKQAWLRFAGWILLALELTLAADVIRTAIAPSWNDIGQLAAIAVIRTFLNFFLERDWAEALEDPKLREPWRAGARRDPPPADR